jgi:hypothetical protein
VVTLPCQPPEVQAAATFPDREASPELLCDLLLWRYPSQNKVMVWTIDETGASHEVDATKFTVPPTWPELCGLAAETLQVMRVGPEPEKSGVGLVPVMVIVGGGSD